MEEEQRGKDWRSRIKSPSYLRAQQATYLPRYSIPERPNEDHVMSVKIEPWSQSPAPLVATRNSPGGRMVLIPALGAASSLKYIVTCEGEIKEKRGVAGRTPWSRC